MSGSITPYVLKEKEPTISRIVGEVQRQVERVSLRFPVELRWEEGAKVNHACEFGLSATQKITIPDIWIPVLQTWSRRVVDGLGSLIEPPGQYQGYVFSLPGEPDRPMSPRLLGWLLAEERDPIAALLASAEATLLHQPEFAISCYTTPVAPCVVRFLQWYKTSSTHSAPSIASYTSVTRGWLSRFGREAACTPTDPILWSHCFARAGKHNMYKTAFLWDQEWRPWLLREYGTAAPGMPGLPHDVLEAYDARPAPLEACWTAEQIRSAPDDPYLTTLLSWASADGRVIVKPRVTPYLPRFAGGDRPVSREKNVLLTRPWDFAAEIEGIQKRGQWWARPQLLQFYPTSNKDFIERDQRTATISRGKVGVSTLLAEPFVHLQGTKFDEEEFVLLRVPTRIASLLQSYAVQLTSGQLPVEPRGRVELGGPPLITEKKTIQDDWLQATPQTTSRESEPEPPKKGSKGRKKTKGSAVFGGGLEGLAGADIVQAAATPRPAVKPVPTSRSLTVEDAIRGGWTRHQWLCVFRRLPDVPNPYDLKRRQRIGELPDDHPRFANGFLVPPEWLPLLSSFYYRLGHPSSLDRVEIPGLDAYLDIPWTAEGAEEWDAAETLLGGVDP